MQTINQPETVEEVTKWLQQAAEQSNLGSEFKATYLRTDGHWLYYAVRLASRDPSERAETLLKLEDAWDAHEPHSEWRLMLVPGS
jgi:hypothetical protein